MQRILISKTTSLGDVLFVLPMVTDIRRQFPYVQIDWLIDESFAALPAMHPAIDRIIGVQLRGRNKKKWIDTSRNLMRTIRVLRQESYDVVLDCQGMIKSDLLSRIAKADLIIGPPNYRLGERVSRFAYHRQVSPDATLPAVEWYRAYAGLALGYRVSGQPDFGIKAANFQPEWLPSQPYVMCFHAASKAEKTWPIECWEGVLKQLEAKGVASILPWGAPHEHEFAQQLAARLQHAVVAPKMSVGEIAGLIERAEWVLGVDTGMTHLAESLAKPTIALYTVTDSATYHPYWNPIAYSLGGNGRIPSVDEVLALLA